MLIYFLFNYAQTEEDIDVLANYCLSFNVRQRTIKMNYDDKF